MKMRDAIVVLLQEWDWGDAVGGLDVTDPETLPLDSPLLQLENLGICPHIASASWAIRAKMALTAAENLIAGLKGERLPSCVNTEVYSKREIP
jgi:glyoxylate reductase